MTWSSGVEELVQLAPEIRENIWVGSNFYYTADTPVAKTFVKNYQAKFGNPPGYAPSAAYAMTRIMLAGFDKAKSVEVPDVITALEGIEVNDLVGRMRVDPQDAPDAAAVLLHALQAEVGDEAPDRLRRHHRHRRHAAAGGIRGLQGHRQLLTHSLTAEPPRRSDP